jgi:DNA-binding response OmpR family regulator
MNEENSLALVPRQTGAIEKAEPGAKRVLSGMIADTLALVKKARPPRIVLLEDEHWLREMLDLAIHQCFRDANVLSFDDGDKAWQELLRVEPDLFITDINHPGKLYAGEMLQSLAAKNVKFPILVHSGLATEEEVRQCGGFDLNLSFLKKPYTAEQFYAELSKHLGHSNNSTLHALKGAWMETLTGLPKTT